MMVNMSSPLPPLDRAKLLFLLTGLAGSFLVGLCGQFAGTNIADLQGGVGASADEASWISTAYTMTSFTGIILSGPLIRVLGLHRYMAVNALVLAGTAFACAAGPELGVMVALRALQGLAAGGFGPVGFLAVFMVMGGKRLPLGLVLLSFVLLFQVTLGPILSGVVEDVAGWQGLFVVQGLVGLTLTLAAFAFLPRQPMNAAALKVDWVAMGLLSVGLALLMLVLSQGTRRFWFDSPMIAWCTAGAIGAWAGFIFLCRYSPLPIINPRLMLTRHFGVPVTLNLVFRAGFAVTTYLVPQFLGIVQGYRPLEIAQLLLWGAIPQALTLPLAWWLLRRLDARAVMGMGLLLCGLGTGLLWGVTSLAAADQFRLALMVFGVGQLLFLAPDLLIGATRLGPADLPTASLAFNVTSLGGTTLGVALVSNLVTEREKFHSNVLTEGLSLYNPLDADRLAALAASLGNRLVDDGAATARAVALLANAARREAWVLSFNDGFLLTAGVLALSALGVFLIVRSPALGLVDIQPADRPGRECRSALSRRTEPKEPVS